MINTKAEPIKIAFFKAPTPKGEELWDTFQKRMDGYILRGHPVYLAEQQSYKMMPAIIACLDFDIVIFDGSIEDDKNEQYFAAIELMKYLDHVLIVSRTCLPFNFEGMRLGGAPRFVNAGTEEYIDRMSNEEIMTWLLDTMEHSSMELPRKLKLNLRENEYRKNMRLVQQVESQMILDASERIEKKQNVFVSYMSRYSKYYQGTRPEEPAVETLFEEICQVSQVPINDIIYFPPGKISLEFMTAQRRFEIIGATEKLIAECKAFWIYDTPDYNLSWWTYGEKMSLLHIFDQNMEKCPDIYVVQPVKDRAGNWTFSLKKYLTPEEKLAFLPKLTAAQRRDLDRIFINANPDTVAYEKVEKMQKFAQMPDALLKLQLKLENPFLVRHMRMILDNDSIREKERQETIKDIRNIDRQIESIRSFVYTKEFWEEYIIQCPFCRASSGKEIFPEKYMYFDEDYFHKVSRSQYHTVLNGLKLKSEYAFDLPCGHSVLFKKADNPYFRWWTVRSDVPTGPDGKLLEKIETLSFK